MSEKREKQTKSKRRIWRGVTTATASLLTLSMSATGDRRVSYGH